MMIHNIEELAHRLGEHAEAVCRYYLPHGRRQGRYWLVGDVAGTPGRSLYVCLSGDRAGRWTDAATDEYGDLLDLIALNRGLDFRATLAEARAFLCLAPTAPEAKRPQISLTGSREAARRLFAASQPITGTVAETYLRRRGIALPLGFHALRFHPHCYYRTAGGHRAWPALIAAVTDLEGDLTGIQRTWLDPRRAGKAPVEEPRRALGRLAGNGVRFGAVRDVLVAGEGIETVLALKTAMPSMSMVAALSAAHLAALVLPRGLRRLYIACDNDAAGRRALQKLRLRGEAAEIEMRPLLPRAEDFNADLLDLGRDHLRDRIAGQLAAEDVCRFLNAGRTPD